MGERQRKRTDHETCVQAAAILSAEGVDLQNSIHVERLDASERLFARVWGYLSFAEYFGVAGILNDMSLDDAGCAELEAGLVNLGAIESLRVVAELLSVRRHLLRKRQWSAATSKKVQELDAALRQSRAEAERLLARHIGRECHRLWQGEPGHVPD